MGERLGRPLIAYLDTHVVLWLAAGKVNRLSTKAKSLLGSSELLLSAMAYLELSTSTSWDEQSSVPATC